MRSSAPMPDTPTGRVLTTRSCRSSSSAPPRFSNATCRHRRPGSRISAAGLGRYALWLADRGYSVIHRDLVPGHVERLAAEAKAVGRVDTAVGDARNLDIEDESVDALLMLGPLYHLTHQGDRVHALREARRILRS